MKAIILVVLALVVGIAATPANAAKPLPTLPPGGTTTQACPFMVGSPSYPVSGTATYSFKRKVKVTVTTFDVDWVPVDEFNTHNYVATFTTPDLKLDSVTIDLNCVLADGQGHFNWDLNEGQSWVIESLCIQQWFMPLESATILEPDVTPSDVTVTVLESPPYEWSMGITNPTGGAQEQESGTVYWTCVEFPHVETDVVLAPGEVTDVTCPDGSTPDPNRDDTLSWGTNAQPSTVIEVTPIANGIRVENTDPVNTWDVHIEFPCRTPTT